MDSPTFKTRKVILDLGTHEWWLKTIVFLERKHWTFANSLGTRRDKQSWLLRPYFANIEDCTSLLSKVWNSASNKKPLKRAVLHNVKMSMEIFATSSTNQQMFKVSIFVFALTLRKSSWRWICTFVFPLALGVVVGFSLPLHSQRLTSWKLQRETEKTNVYIGCGPLPVTVVNEGL